MEKTLQQHINEHPDIEAGKAIALIWDTTDLLELEMGPDQKYPINEREAAEILKNIESSHDGNLGVTWDGIEHAIQDYLNENPRAIYRAEVAVGVAYGSHESGGWSLMQVDVPAHELEDLTNAELVAAFERTAILELDERGEECVFVRTIAWERTYPEEDDADA